MPGNNVLLTSLVEQTPSVVISMFPQTIGWKILFVICLFSIIYFLYVKIQKWKSNRYRREAYKQLTSLDPLSTQQATQQLNRIVKKTASMAFGEKQVASLYGDEWLAFLDKTSVNSFDIEATKQWQMAIYNPRCCENMSNETLKQLIVLCGLWIQQHEVSL